MMQTVDNMSSGSTGKKGVISPYFDISGFASYSGMWHSHIHRAFPGFEEAADICRHGGFSFLGVTEHDCRFPQVELGEKEWYKVGSEDFLVIRGFEASHPMGHVTCLGFLPEQTGVDVLAAYRNRFEGADLDAGYEGFLENAAALGAFTALNHPASWRDKVEELISWPGFEHIDAMEIYNGGRAGKSESKGCADDLYDACLSRGHRLWCGANPDCHSWDTELPDGPYNGYSVVFASSLSRSDILESLKAGRFYASTGLHLDELSLTGESLAVGAENCRRISFYGSGRKLLQEQQGGRAEYRFKGDEGYVRAELEGPPASLKPGEASARAWLQPVWLQLELQ